MATVNKTEEHYGASYSQRELPPQIIEEWRKPTFQAALPFHLPKKNEFIASDFRILSGNSEDTFFSPQVILETPSAKLWHKPDFVFRKPRTHALFVLLAPEVYSSPRDACLTSCFIALCNDALNAYTYHAEVAGLSFGVNHTLDGIEVV